MRIARQKLYFGLFRREKICKPAIFSAAFLLLASSAIASENGVGVYPVGINTVLNGILPPPGETQFYTYNQYYSASKFAGSKGQSIVPDFHLDYFVTAPRVMHTWNVALGPFTLSSGANIPLFLPLHLSTPGGTGNRSGLGDLNIEPLTLNYTNPSHTFFIFLDPLVSLPTGSYSPNRIANTGLNKYTFNPYLSMTWFPSREWEISTTVSAEFSGPNRSTGYHNGIVTYLDYLFGYSVNEHVQLGLQGFAVKQVTDDKVNGQPAFGDGFRGQALGIGPQLRYTFTETSGIVLKYQREFAVRNRPQGNRLWLEFSFRL